MSSAAIPPENNNRRQALWFVLSTLCFLAVVVLLSIFVFTSSRLSVASPTAIVLAPAGREVRPLAQMRAGPQFEGRGDKITSVPEGDATHTKHLIYFGTDRTPSTPLSGVSFHVFFLLTLGYVAALMAAIVLWFSARKHGRLIALLFIAAIGFAAFAAFEFFPIRHNKLAAEAFGDGRAELTCGVCTVSVPHGHEPGGLEGPSLMHFEFREDVDKHIVLQRVQPLSISEFKEDFQIAAQDSAWREAIVFIHGYNTTFEDAARRTAQLSHDLEFGGLTAFFSWPSNGHLESYFWDVNAADYAVAHFKEFLELLANSGQLKRIHVIAHSMGNRCATAAISQGLALQDCELDQCILAAADVDAVMFKRDFATKIVDKVGKLTLYASSKDRALNASQWANRYPRAGDARELVFVNGMETVDATDLETDYLGHAYFGDRPPLIDDLKQIIDEHLPASKRDGMKEFFATGRLKYWKFSR